MPETPDRFPLPPEARALVLGSWQRVVPLADVFALTLYRHLFERAPHLRELFHTDIGTQGRRVFEALDALVGAPAAWAAIEPGLVKLGRRHGYVGVKPQDFADLAWALHRTFEDILVEAYPAPVRDAWGRLLGAVSAAMIRGMEEVGDAAKDCDTTRFFRTPPELR